MTDDREHRQHDWRTELLALRDAVGPHYRHQFDFHGHLPPEGWEGPRFYPPLKAWRVTARLDRDGQITDRARPEPVVRRGLGPCAQRMSRVSQVQRWRRVPGSRMESASSGNAASMRPAMALVTVRASRSSAREFGSGGESGQSSPHKSGTLVAGRMRTAIRRPR
jgi:hypothetical protein